MDLSHYKISPFGRDDNLIMLHNTRFNLQNHLILNDDICIIFPNFPALICNFDGDLIFGLKSSVEKLDQQGLLIYPVK